MLVELSVVEQRYHAVMEVLSGGIPVVEVAERYGVSRKVVHAWLRRYRQDGLPGLTDRSHRPQPIMKSTPPTAHPVTQNDRRIRARCRLSVRRCTGRRSRAQHCGSGCGRRGRSGSACRRRPDSRRLPARAEPADECGPGRHRRAARSGGARYW